MNRLRTDSIVECLARLREEADVLAKAAGDFPAVQRNVLRVKASIRMMEIDLGMETVGSKS